MDDPQYQTSLNIPSLLAFAVISFFAIRYLFFSSASTASASASRSGARATTVPLDKIEQVAAMFPQLSRRDVEWDLLRNGMSVQATTEKVLREGRLPAAPPNFRAQPNPTHSSTSSSSTSTTRTQPKPSHPDLITRYNLSSRVSGASSTTEEEETPKKQGWSQNKAERQALLAKRRDEMVLAARRKLEERERKGKEKEVGRS